MSSSPPGSFRAPQELLAKPERRAELKSLSRDWPSWTLTERQLCDVELLLNGGFTPLTGFLCRADYEHVCEHMHLADGSLWSLPICLDVTPESARTLATGDMLALRDQEGVMVAALHVEEVWQPDRRREAELVYGTTSPGHPGVAYLRQRVNPWYVGGRIEGLQLPVHYDYRELRHTPRELRETFARLGWRRIVAFQTRKPLHRPHVELLLRVARELEADVLVHPVVGPTKPGDLDHYTRVRCYQAVMRRFPRHTAMLSLLPLAMRMAGPREALLHALVRRNYGCTHFLVGRDHAGPGVDRNGGAFYDVEAALDLALDHQRELGVAIVPSRFLVYVPEQDRYVPEDEVPKGARALSLSEQEFKERLADGREIPPWVSYPEVVRELQRAHPPRARRGFTVFFTGLPCAGKSTLANVLLVKLLERGDRPVTLLDGDIVRTHLSSELGFSKEHRDLNIRRIGFVAAEITKNGGIAICAPIAPYDAVRKQVRRMVETGGGFILVHVTAPVSVCEQRDRKGLYAKARAGVIKAFTGVSDPYEEPPDADVTIDTTASTPEQGVQGILLHLEKLGYLTGADDAST